MPWLAFLATFLKSLSSVSEKKALQTENPEVYTAALSFVLSIISLPLLFFAKDFTITGGNMLWIYLSSLFSIISSVTAAYAIKKVDVSESAVIFSFGPLCVSLFALFFLGETLHTLQWAGIFLSCFGLIVLEYKGHHEHGVATLHVVHVGNASSTEQTRLKNKSTNHFIHIMFFLSIFFFACAAVTDKFILHSLGIDPLFYLVILQIFISLNFIAVRAYKGICLKIAQPHGKHHVSTIKKGTFWLNIFFIVCHRVSHIFALQAMSASLLNAIKQLSAVFSVIIGGRLFSEKNIGRRLLACLCVVGGVVLVILM